ncbi:hypothetical protein [Maricaulis maris]|uniref:hypothetical protein n=1 Tax=Maricaulis maris TaxID=74318 RepID=UPI003B8B76ED
MTHRYATLDVFTDQALGGNPLAVVSGADKLVSAIPRLAETLAQGDGYGWRVDGALTEDDLDEDG